MAALEGFGKLGPEQVQWLEADLKGQPVSRPVVVFAHIQPLAQDRRLADNRDELVAAVGLTVRSAIQYQGHIRPYIRTGSGLEGNGGPCTRSIFATYFGWAGIPPNRRDCRGLLSPRIPQIPPKSP